MWRRGLAALLLVACSEPRQSEVPRPYVRHESAAELKLYQPFAEYYRENPPELARFISILQKRTGLAPSLPSYPTDLESIHRAAAAFEAAAQEVFGFPLSLNNGDPKQYDVLFNTHLIDAKVQRYFGGAKLRDMTEKESDEYSKAVEAIRIPREPLFFYCAGAHWGEWLVRHRQATWQLYPPLRPIQAFSDMISASNTMCYHPFAQVTGKMSDPEGDALDFASSPEIVSDRYLPPFPLLATPADAQQAAKMALPAEVRDASSTEDYARFLNRSENAPVRVYGLAIEQAWKEKEWMLFETWSRAAIKLAPRNTMLRHNLAVVLSNDPQSIAEAISLLRQTLAQNENYARAHLTLASCLLDTGQRDEARKHAEWVRDHDGQLKRDAEELLARIGK
jgi:hypothetical protein